MTKGNANENTFGAQNTRRDILITTPLKLVHLIRESKISLANVQYLVCIY